jgi:hypothetical protein
MDLEILKKKLSSYRTEGGYLKKVNEDLMIEVLLAWEHWTGPVKGFYAAIGVNKYSLAKLIGNAKKLRREGFPTDGFKEIKLAPVGGMNVSSDSGAPCSGIEMSLEGGKLVRFQQVDQLVDFLKKVA